MLTLSVNGEPRTVEAPADMPLLWVLRDLLGLTGTKFGCGIAQCGACTVHLDGQAVRACVLPVSAVGARQVTTVEALSRDPVGARVQKAWLDIEVVQCGYCQSGQVMSAAALLHHTPNPSDADIDTAMSGNICRCGTYARIREAIKLAATGRTTAMPTIPIEGATVVSPPGSAGPPPPDAPAVAQPVSQTGTESLDQSANPARPGAKGGRNDGSRPQ